MPRFALLEHTAAPGDPAGRHFDLLLEVGSSCRTWRLMELPQAGGEVVAAMELPPHRLAWLERLEGDVSGGRGFARRVDAGSYNVLACDAEDVGAATLLTVAVQGSAITGRLQLEAVAADWAVRLG